MSTRTRSRGDWSDKFMGNAMWLLAMIVPLQLGGVIYNAGGWFGVVLVVASLLAIAGLIVRMAIMEAAYRRQYPQGRP